ncbi:MAG: GNAT family N-acetyltransferase [Caldilineaceae bacterium]
MPLQVEQADEQDIAAWLMLAQEVSDLFGADMAGDPVFQAWAQRSIERGAVYCVRIDGAVAGVMQYRKHTINWLAVTKRFRRRGVARALVAHALAAGAPTVRVTTFGEGHPHPDAALARAFYQGLGFLPIQEPIEPVADGTPRVELVWYNSYSNLDDCTAE